MEHKRQTGRTERIIAFAIDQLHQNGEVIITDHAQYEGLLKTKDRAIQNARSFAKTLEYRYNQTQYPRGAGMKRIVTRIVEVPGLGIQMVHATLAPMNTIESQMDKIGRTEY